MKRVLVSLLAFVVMSIAVTACVFAEDGMTAKSTMYEICKQKNYVYVQGSNGLYRVKLKKGKPVSKKKIVKCGKKYAMEHLMLNGKYVYFKKAVAGKAYIYRVKKTGGTAKKLASMDEFGQMAIKGNKIYYTYDGDETDEDGMILTTYKKVMNLDGTGKADTDVEAVEKDKYYNVKGYKYTYKMTKKAVITYLKTPKGKIALEKQSLM